jgi:RecA-family ATPase
MSLVDFKGNEILDWSRVPSDELWGYMIRYSRGDKHSAEIEFRQVMKHRNVSQFKTEKMLDTYLGASGVIDFEPQSLLEIYEQGTQGEHIIPNFLIAGQVTIVHGKSGSGKSTLVKQAVRSVLTAEPFIDRPVVKGQVLLIELDEPTSWTAETLIDKMRLPIEDASRLQIVSNVSAGDGIGSLNKYLSSNSGVRLVVIDTLQSFCQVENINDNSEVGRVLQSLRDLLKTHTSLQTCGPLQ